MDLLVLFSFLKALRANPLMSLWGLPLTSCILLFVSHCQVTSNPGLCSISICQLAVWSSGMILAPGALGSVPRTALASFTGKCYKKLQAPASSVLVWMLVLPLQDSFSRCFAPVFQPCHVSMLFSILVARAAG